MATLKLQHIDKIYPNNVQAVFDFNLEIKDKEFIVLVGPSGCGKSTTLRMIAGLEEISNGELYIDDKLVNTVMPKDRDIAMVFQNYALYPHMTVFENMAFGIKIRKHPVPVLDENGNQKYEVDTGLIKEAQRQIKDLKDQDEVDEAKISELENKINELKANPSKPSVKMIHYTKEEIKERVEKAADILGLTQYLKRKPAALSGGQRQRVALGRAIVRNAKVFLMDEPLSNLDAKLRVQMRSEIARIHEAVGATTVYVTHDQTEAMTMASRIVIMKDGYVQQIGTPMEVYKDPNNIFVASFIGSPAMNFLNGTFDGESLVLDEIPGEEVVKLPLCKEHKELLKDYVNKSIVFGIRPEDMYLEKDAKKADNQSAPIKILCDIKELLGNELIVYGSLASQRVSIKTNSEFDIKPHDLDEYTYSLDRAYFFDKETTNRIR
ncbi:MAG: ATP-binding cassette domain-containing protein [Bacilli bacterium]|nr:ATP-binding cassette domain-containing protein [Bacilli bacterium]